ncbi:methyl-accepting chemotaxis protein [Sphingomonas kyeonggiensis]|uniref:Methyl-accepting chemotaxis protein n=1 Tax=Sphingomonas kyeonggiensis TaxID=1268553 RepID=A0A7W7K675_9SPHN|nr:methyl-accepting chemotaxis protein [Sphingomonas kyeonggiensis]MBB4841281.1 methyl-accepting chemotaxis protein [Sphingomonas kyeonggiensis]
MMQWFEANAPIRQKTLVAFGTLLSLVLVLGLLSAIREDWLMVAASAAAASVGTTCAWRFRRAICDPYVNTVVRMEALAAGDLESPVAYTAYKDCVGRMTRAMFTFRDTAREQIRASQEQSEVVAALRASLASLTQGDFTAEIRVEFPSAYAELKTNFNEALASLRTLVGSVLDSAESINTGAAEIAQASEDLARRTEANAASLEQTTAAVAQMDERLRATAEAASRTVRRADGAIQSVAGGRTTAGEAVNAMTRVSESATGIDDVIEGLDKIAFQTRVLAMNAAVEAGRAGEAGRGFAVVADLVSALAMRAEEEAGRAREQLTATRTDVVAAVEMVQKVDAAFTDIFDNVGEVHVLLADIAASNQAQSAAIAEISVAVGSMDQATQQNAAMVEETSAAARNLSVEVGGLSDQAERFNVGDSAAALGRRSGSTHYAPKGKPGKNAGPQLARAALGTKPPSGDWASF